jgi:predicted GNAT superfamily acetyltransferase
VLPAYQNKGIGYALKLAQRQAALAQKLELITWTFDPLQARNAYLNLNKLGAVCNTYLSNLYGEMRDQLNQGLPSDRFRVDWWIATKRVADCLAGSCPIPAADSPILNTATQMSRGWRVPAETFNPPHEFYCRVEVPFDLQALKPGAPEIARQWRLHIREVFQAAFTAGYTAVALLRQTDRNYYLLQKDWQPETRIAEAASGGIERNQ